MLIRYLPLKNAMTSRQGLALSGYCQGIVRVLIVQCHYLSINPRSNCYQQRALCQ
ncbi:hypothetical protein MOSL_0657 [Moraxella osloensis]|nr:hypothetical protein MOSL_0657 [Moraxella osloensis]